MLDHPLVAQRFPTEALESDLDYWRSKLGGDLPILALPVPRSSASTQPSWGACRSPAFPAHLTTQLKALSHREAATLFMTLLAAFQALLARYTDQDDIL